MKVLLLFKKLKAKVETYQRKRLTGVKKSYKQSLTQIGSHVVDSMNVPPQYKPFCIESMAHLWRDLKYRVKKRGYYAYETDEGRLANCPPSVVQEQWITLVAKWGKDEVERLDSGKPTDRLSMYIASRTDEDGHTKDRTGDYMIEKLIDAINELLEEDRNSSVHCENTL